MKKINSIFLFLLLTTPFVACDDEEVAGPTTASFHSATYTAAESDGTITLGIKLDQPAKQEVVIELAPSGTATEGTDYTMQESSITIPVGGASASVVIDLVSDIIDDDDETIVLTLTSAGQLKTSGETYTVTITDDDCAFDHTGAFGGVDGTFQGFDYEGTANVSIVQDGSTYTIDGLNVDFMENLWGEEIQESVPVTFTVDAEGQITIEDQYIFTTLYDGDLYEYRISGTGHINTCDGTITLDYEMDQDGFLVGKFMHDNNYMDDEIFKAVLKK